jgi:hypothetical protein
VTAAVLRSGIMADRGRPETRRPLSIVALMADGDQRQELGRALPDATVWFCARGEALRELARAQRAQVVVTSVRDAEFGSVAPTLHALAALPSPPHVVLTFALTLPELREVDLVLGQGLAPHLALTGIDRLGAAVGEIVAGSPGQSAERTLLRRLLPMVPGPVRPFFAACVLKGRSALSVSEGAALAATSVRTLEDRLSRERLPVARQVLSWIRVLHAAWRLDVMAMPIKRVVDETAVPSRRALNNLLKRHVGLTPTAMAEYGGFATALERFLALLEQRGAADLSALPQADARSAEPWKTDREAELRAR